MFERGRQGHTDSTIFPVLLYTFSDCHGQWLCIWWLWHPRVCMIVFKCHWSKLHLALDFLILWKSMYLDTPASREISKFHCRCYAPSCFIHLCKGWLITLISRCTSVTFLESGYCVYTFHEWPIWSTIIRTWHVDYKTRAIWPVVVAVHQQFR